MQIRLKAFLMIMAFGPIAVGQSNWTNMITVETSPTISLSQLASDPAGKLAILAQKHDGQTTGQDVRYPGIYRRHADIYVTHADSLNSSWTTPVRLSNPLQFNVEPDICAGAQNEFWVTWTSGDPFSDFRLHTAVTIDGGISYTTQTIRQSITDQNQGSIFPQIEKAGAATILSATGFQQNLSHRPSRAYFKTSSIGDFTSSITYETDLPASSATEQIMSSPDLKSNGANILIQPFCHIYSDPAFNPPLVSSPLLVRSTDGGMTWTQHDDLITSRVGPHIALNTDRQGTWVILYKVRIEKTGYNGSWCVQVSRNDGLTWNSPQLLSPSNMDLYSPPIYLETDGAGRWLAVCSNRLFTYSEDNGGTWAPVTFLQSPLAPHSISDLDYLGSGKWALVGNYRESFNSPYRQVISTMQWGESEICDWELYD